MLIRHLALSFTWPTWKILMFLRYASVIVYSSACMISVATLSLTVFNFPRGHELDWSDDNYKRRTGVYTCWSSLQKRAKRLYRLTRTVVVIIIIIIIICLLQARLDITRICVRAAFFRSFWHFKEKNIASKSDNVTNIICIAGAK